jgi:hypothetical protein
MAAELDMCIVLQFVVVNLMRLSCCAIGCEVFHSLVVVCQIVAANDIELCDFEALFSTSNK